MVLSSMNNPNMECDHIQFQKGTACIPLFFLKNFFSLVYFFTIMTFWNFCFFYSKAKINLLKELQNIQYSRYCIGYQSSNIIFGTEQKKYYSWDHTTGSTPESSAVSIPFRIFISRLSTPLHAIDKNVWLPRRWEF